MNARNTAPNSRFLNATVMIINGMMTNNLQMSNIKISVTFSYAPTILFTFFTRDHEKLLEKNL